MKFHLDSSDFDACPEFNQWVDEQCFERYGTLDIIGFQPRPSLVLFSLSQDTYQAAFDDFKRQREEDLKEIIYNDFPSPIAHYFYRFENGFENDLQRLHFLRDTWEAIVDLLHAIAVAECRFVCLCLSDPIAFKDFLSNKVAQRLLNIERIISQAEILGIRLQIADIVSVQTLQMMRSLNQSRNAFSHTAALSEKQARDWTNECYVDVIDIIDDMRRLGEIQILRYMGQIDGCTLRCEVFRGHSFTRTINTIKLSGDHVTDPQRFFQQGQILAFINKHIFGIRPLVHYREDSSGQSTKLCMFRKAHGNKPNRLIEYEVVGESKRWNEDRNVFKAEIDELRKLFRLPPD